MPSTYDKHKGFALMPELPEGVAELFALTKYHVDYAAPRYYNGARMRNTGGFKVFTADGVCVSKTIPHDFTLDQWRDLLGEALDYDLRWNSRKLSDLFRDPKGE